MVLLFASFLSLLTTVYGLTLSLQQGNGAVSPAPTSTATSSTGSTSAAAPPVSSAPPAVTVPHWGQCGGIGWTGPTVCAAPYTCVPCGTGGSVYYWNCL
ncbi:carbohydrate-binding module family 1 protein [Sphaerobolus stellatus SS14]|uniref:Carbohydrate-binding module family 1 protein n=1 Tax=Sphaerobolus stellatus (strain SS14) TaxID=990650 RepID=A0A0C9VWR9_SPHS4|nr:carbohydrate-binding module family 1 protein [Sphaerobolus stellatus SS14]